MLLKILMILFLVYIPIYALTLIVLLKSNKEFSIHSVTVSSLVQLSKKKAKIFNTATMLYGFLSIPTILKYIAIIDINIHSILCILLYTIVSIGTICVGILPKDRHARPHTIVAILLFSTLFLASFVFSLSFLFSPSLINISIFSLIQLILTSILFYKVENMTNETKFAFWEWMSLFGTMIWNIVFTYSLL